MNRRIWIGYAQGAGTVFQIQLPPSFYSDLKDSTSSTPSSRRTLSVFKMNEALGKITQ